MKKYSPPVHYTPYGGMNKKNKVLNIALFLLIIGALIGATTKQTEVVHIYNTCDYEEKENHEEIQPELQVVENTDLNQSVEKNMRRSNIVTFSTNDQAIEKILDSQFSLGEKLTLQTKVELLAQKMRKWGWKVSSEDILSVMICESQLNIAINNKRGSGAKGLIQMTPKALSDINRVYDTRYVMSDISDINKQFQIIEKYFSIINQRYGKVDGAVELYTAVFYPRGLRESNGPFFKKGHKYWSKNKMLDHDRNGVIDRNDLAIAMQKHIRKRLEQA